MIQYSENDEVIFQKVRNGKRTKQSLKNVMMHLQLLF